MKYVIIFGNPVSGFWLHGPFDSTEEATEYAEGSLHDWWVMSLFPPEENDSDEGETPTETGCD